MFDAFHDQPAVEPHPPAGVIHLGAGGIEDAQRLIGEKLEAEIFKHIERGLMDLLDLLLAPHLDGLIGVADPTPGRLLETAASARLAVSPATLSRHDEVLNFRLVRRGTLRAP